MSTEATSDLPASDLYDPDDVLPRDSPLLEPRRPRLKLSPSPAPTLSSSSTSSAVSRRNGRLKRRNWVRPNQGDAILIGHLDGHRRELAAYEEIEPWITDTEDSGGPEDAEEPEHPAFRDRSMSPTSPSGDLRAGMEQGHDDASSRTANGESAHAPGKTAVGATTENVGAFDLRALESLAADALAVAEPRTLPDAGPTPPVTDNDVVSVKGHPTPASAMPIHTRRNGTQQPERTGPPTMPSPYSPASIYSPREVGNTPMSSKTDMRSPTASIHSSTQGEGLPPLQLNSPRYETSGQTLPSIRSQLGDIPQLVNSPGAGSVMRGLNHGFSGSPPTGMPRLPSLSSQLGSPPLPPADPYRDPLSPIHPLAYYPPSNGLHRPHEYTASSPEAVGSHQSGSPLSVQGLDRMSIDGMAIQTVGSYICRVPGCQASPFQTQYLLNSHANVHSSARPHYCPVQGCPRGEGGKGFKRKNEMIRHGLVHESPGYICPFCPDRDHRYPRPDNLQRHVRVHHVDKQRDDPLLRDVLAQRPGGPNRGRRRRAGPS
ncbi:hypothetical protein B0J18DRAFT_366416 [Chaetomium sp. MPI-SDFR-AT-0129]|nr:hypothetical protein B0J18DRAFT_366416 [Chaetomium sp. MPI-SDFR-AT-0129]